MLLGVDVGGTFTDAVISVEGRLVTAKAPSTPRDQSEGVLEAIRLALQRAGARPEDVTEFAHGMTVATNALLEGRAARTVLVATEGFTDVVELGRQARADLYRLCAAHPAPLVPPELRFGAPERMGPEGPLRPLEPGAASALCERVAGTAPEAVAVVLLHAYRHPEHERALAAELARRLPGVHVSLSHEVVGTFREYERAATTEVDAALSPLLGGYLRRLIERSKHEGVPRPSIMQSSGGLADAGLAASHAALTVLSGPAAGAAGAAFVARRAGLRDALCFDMGGTSCDVCLVQDGRVAETAQREVAGRPLALPAVDIHTVGAGGGSIAWRDPGGALRVGPHSAGAEPGPACYGRGGDAPTVTDANLLLGYLAPGAELSGGIRLDAEAARTAIGRLAASLGLDVADCAAGIVRVASAEMARALRVITVERGIDPRDHALLAFGGAGPLHATAVAEELGVTRVLCPHASGVLAALGLVVSERRHDAQRSVLLAGEDLSAERIAREVGELARRAREAVGDPSAPVRCGFDLRYRGQAFELTVPGDERALPDDLHEAFAAVHEERYGYRDPEGVIELVTVRVTAALPGPDVELSAESRGEPARGRRTARFGGEELEADLLAGPLPAGTRIAGPALCELPEATLVVSPGWRGEVGEHGGLELERADAPAGAGA